MRRQVLLAVLAAAMSGLTANHVEAVLITGATPVNVIATDYSRTPDRGAVGTVTSTQQGGAYSVNGTFGGSFYTGAAAVASGSAANPSFQLTFTNDTGVEITGLSFSGTRIQFKDNTSNLNEVLTASVTGLSGVSSPAFNIAAVGNDSSTVSFRSASYSVNLPLISLLDGESFTIRWTDANDGGTDAMFGIANLSVTATLAVAAIPEPTAALFGSLLAGAFGLVVARRPADRD